MTFLRDIIDRLYYRFNPMILLGEALNLLHANYSETITYFQAVGLKAKWGVIHGICESRLEEDLIQEDRHYYRDLQRHLLNLGKDLKFLQ